MALPRSSRAATAPRRYPRGLLRIVIAAATVAIASLVMEFVTDASLLSETFRHTAARMFAPYNAYFYGRSSQTALISERLLVVNVGQTTLDRYGSAPPMAYGHHARILEQIRRGQPTALFVDFQFQTIRQDPSLPALLDVLCAYKADGIPVFLAAGSDGKQGALRPELESLRDAEGRSCFEKVAVDYDATGPDKLVWTYPLLGDESAPTRKSAALAMAEALAATTGAAPPLVRPEHRVMGLDWASSDRHHGPAWAADARTRQALAASAAAARGTADGQINVDTNVDARGHANANANANAAVTAAEQDSAVTYYCRAPALTDIIPLQTFFGRILGREPDKRPACPLHESVEAYELTARHTAEQRVAQNRQLKDRAVFYGGSFDSGDIINSPLHGELPGVYLHAQAADNLARHGSAWRHPEMRGRLGEWAEWPMLALSFFLVALLLMIGRLALRGLWRQLLRPYPGSRLSRRLDRSVKPRLALAKARLRRPLAGAHALRWFRGPQGLLDGLSHALRNLFSNLGNFYLSLLLVVPLSWLLERAFQVSIIGYSNVLAFCLLGEVFTASARAQRSLHEQPPEPGIAGP